MWVRGCAEAPPCPVTAQGVAWVAWNLPSPFILLYPLGARHVLKVVTALNNLDLDRTVKYYTEDTYVVLKEPKGVTLM